MTIRVNHAPVAEAGAEIVTDHLYVTLDGSASSDADGDRLIHTWDFGDGSPPATGDVVTHAYPRSGIFPVTLTVDDGTGLDNAVAVDSTRVLIDARPDRRRRRQPRRLLGRRHPLRRLRLVSDPDGGLLRYDWDFGDGTRSDIVNPNKTYEQPGVYTVTLTVRDESGLPIGVHSDRVAAVVREAPIADAGAPIMACTNQTVRFDGSNSTDADGAVNAFSWNFGDASSGGGERPTHVYERPGSLQRHPHHHRRRPRRLRRARHRRDRRDRDRGAARRDRRPRPHRRRHPDALPGAALRRRRPRRRALRLGLRRRRHRHRPGSRPRVRRAGGAHRHAPRRLPRRYPRLRHHRDPPPGHGERPARAGHRRARPGRRRRPRAPRRLRLQRPRRRHHRLRLGLRRRRHRQRRAGAAPLRPARHLPGRARRHRRRRRRQQPRRRHPHRHRHPAAGRRPRARRRRSAPASRTPGPSPRTPRT